MLVTLVESICHISGFPELANLLLLTCCFEFLSCPKVKARLRAVAGHKTKSKSEQEDSSEPEDDKCSEPQDDEADCQKKIEDLDDVPTEADFSTDEALSEVDLTSSTEETKSGGEEEVEEVVRTPERKRWADFESDDEDFFLGSAPISQSLEVHTPERSRWAPSGAPSDAPDAEVPSDAESEDMEEAEVLPRWRRHDHDEVSYNELWKQLYSHHLCSQPEVIMYSRQYNCQMASPEQTEWQSSTSKSPGNKVRSQRRRKEARLAAARYEGTDQFDEPASEQPAERVIWKRDEPDKMLYKRDQCLSESKQDYDCYDYERDLESMRTVPWVPPAGCVPDNLDSKLDYDYDYSMDQVKSWQSPKSSEKKGSIVARSPLSQKYSSSGPFLSKSDLANHPWCK